MNGPIHRLWAGTLLLLAATALQVTADGGWSLALIAVLGIMLVLKLDLKSRAAVVAYAVRNGLA